MADTAPDLSALEALGPGDISGSDTFSRYRYQTKMAVQLWLTCLLEDGPTHIVVEYVEDLVVVYVDRQRFIQVKTRTAGRSAWTFSAVCDDGLDSLVRAYGAAKHLPATFELLLEGPASNGEVSQAFFQTPAALGRTGRKTLRDKTGLAARSVNGFLSRLQVHPGAVSRASIDDRNIALLATVLRTVTAGQILQTYRDLLDAAAAAQEADAAPSGMADWGRVVRAINPLGDEVPDDLERRLLTRDRLLEILPELPVRSPDEWERLLSDKKLSDLERKLIIANATQPTIDRAKALRAAAETRRIEIEAGPKHAIGQLVALAEDVLTYARAVATAHSASMRPGDEVFAALTTGYLSLNALDQNALFEARPFAVLGYLCHLSDECHFGWRAHT
ncbi:MAG TPA: dsDNA nuclease domain-containing protein [Mycobacteriales bacterium]|nr:dsDNA nuclease domain-containing protein [Mycobacteriales bacterium]